MELDCFADGGFIASQRLCFNTARAVRRAVLFRVPFQKCSAEGLGKVGSDQNPHWASGDGAIPTIDTDATRQSVRRRLRQPSAGGSVPPRFDHPLQLLGRRQG